MHIAIVGAGMAGIACARTLVQAGHQVMVFEKSKGLGGRMSTRSTPFGSFDHGAQYFTVRDARFAKALENASRMVKPWSANSVRVLDDTGRVVSAGLPAREPHFVATPGMNELVRYWAQPLVQSGSVTLQNQVSLIERDALHPGLWQLRTLGVQDERHVYAGFDAVLLAVPHVQTRDLLSNMKLSEQQGRAVVANFLKKTDGVQVAPCWTAMLAFPQALQPTMSHLGPQWNAARSTHHRIAWLARESSKPGRAAIERWTVQASAEWSKEHLEDDAPRVLAKLQRAFAELTGIRAEPAHAEVHRWRYAKTEQSMGTSHLWSADQAIGLCGDWCLGHRVENAFVSGLELALAVHAG
jgi:renalase